MTAEQVSRPDESEFAPHARVYVELVPHGDLLEHLRRQIDDTLGLLQPVAEDRATTLTYAPGKWTLKEVVGHLSDTERILSCRALRVARADPTPLPGFEQDDYVRAAGAHRRTLASLCDEFRAVREATLALFQSFSPEDWLRCGTVSGRNLSARGLAFTLAGHELHHAKLLRELYLNR